MRSESEITCTGHAHLFFMQNVCMHVRLKKIFKKIKKQYILLFH